MKIPGWVAKLHQGQGCIPLLESEPGIAVNQVPCEVLLAPSESPLAHLMFCTVQCSWLKATKTDFS